MKTMTGPPLSADFDRKLCGWYDTPAGEASRFARRPARNRRAGSAHPVAPIPLADGVRAELREAGEALRLIAQADGAALRRLLRLIGAEGRALAEGRA